MGGKRYIQGHMHPKLLDIQDEDAFLIENEGLEKGQILFQI